MSKKKKPNLELLAEAAAIIDGIPGSRFNLNLVAKNGDPNFCGTMGCAMGWLSMHPKFIALGLGLAKISWGDDSCEVTVRGCPVSYVKAAAEIFNISEVDALNLFSPRSDSRFDQARPGKSGKELSHKATFRNRICCFLAENDYYKY